MNIKTQRIFLLLIVISVLWTSIGYSALSSNLLISGEAHIRVKSDIRINNITWLNSNNQGYETYNSEYYKDGIKVYTTLPNIDSSVTYQIEIKNNTNIIYIIDSINEIINSNEYMTYTIDNINSDILNNEVTIINLTIKYKDDILEVPSNNVNVIELQFDMEIKDVTPPVLTTQLISKTDKTATINITATDEINGSGLSDSNKYQYCLSTSSTVVENCTWTNYSNGSNFNVIVANYGTYYLFVYAVSDNRGNISDNMANNQTYYIKNNFTFFSTINLYDYTGSEQVFTVPESGYYKLETWGAQGGTTSSGAIGGYGSYSKGTIYLNKGQILYLNVGGQGASNNSTTGGAGGYNGGGTGGTSINSNGGGSGGGGATHIATQSGLLSSLSSSISSVLIVSGGGGGSMCWENYVGGSAGGYQGVIGKYYSVAYSAATQTSGNAFGQGYNCGTKNGDGYGSEGNGGGGGGFYGGLSLGTGTNSNAAGGGGSGYIGNTSLINKAMYCYNCTTSSIESTQTISTTNVSSEAISNYAKSGNGYAKITYIGDKAISVGDTFDYTYTGSEQVFTVPESGYYKLETWGAQGGYGKNETYYGGYGGYSTGTIELTKGDKLYINVGGKGIDGTSETASAKLGGYNGGGTSYGTTSKYVGSGGGATHIALQSGLLSSLSSATSSVLIVSGGGGGGGYESSSYTSTGGVGGGITGASGIVTGSSHASGGGGSQTAGGTSYQGTAIFGQAANATSDSIGGGGGYYGGGTGKYTSGGGGGSGYIGNTLLSGKVMYCYNCTESSETSTKTISTTNVSSEAISNYAKKGNGYVRITFFETLNMEVESKVTNNIAYISINISNKTNSKLSNSNIYKYYLSTSSTSLTDGTWQDYTPGVEFQVSNMYTTKYLWIYSISTTNGIINDNKVSSNTPYMIKEIVVLPEYTYTGESSLINDGSGNWRIKFLTSGTLTMNIDYEIDAFLVGGGSSMGGSGYTLTQKNISITKGTEYSIVVGDGGSPGNNGTASIFYVDDTTYYTATAGNGANGGSGAGSAGYTYPGGSGGSDGSSGYTYQGKAGASGQGTTTREFGESTGTLYAGGGGGGGGATYGDDATDYSGGSGGFGGGGNGGGSNGSCTNGATNTGGGAGTGIRGATNCYGGSGIVIIRNAR